MLADIIVVADATIIIVVAVVVAVAAAAAVVVAVAAIIIDDSDINSINAQIRYAICIYFYDISCIFAMPVASARCGDGAGAAGGYFFQDMILDEYWSENSLFD